MYILLIVSDDVCQQVVPLVYQLSQSDSIYLFRFDRRPDWISQIRKLKDIVNMILNHFVICYKRIFDVLNMIILVLMLLLIILHSSRIMIEIDKKQHLCISRSVGKRSGLKELIYSAAGTSNIFRTTTIGFFLLALLKKSDNQSSVGRYAFFLFRFW